MKHFLLALFLLCNVMVQAQQIDLSGIWHFAIDRNDVGIAEKWYERLLPEEVSLPGSMMTNGKGDPVNVDTKWTASMIDSTFYTADRYARYRQPDNFKVSFFLQPDKYYAGVAWYQREVTIPAEWKDKVINLFLERCHWESRIWIDGREAGMQNTLSAPQEYGLTELLAPGKHLISIRVDNRVREINPGVDAHSVTDHTQGNWNGIVGSMYLEAKPGVCIERVDAYPLLSKKELKLKLNVANHEEQSIRTDLVFRLEGSETMHSYTLQSGNNGLEVTLPLSQKIAYWDEFHPNLYDLTVTLQAQNVGTDTKTVTFGCREWEVKDGAIYLNGRPAFMRGTLHCAAFPLTGYPSTNKEEWLRELRICQSYGINHIRFHSWCPPEAAFQAADELGMYFQVECSAWAAVGDGLPVDSFLYAEAAAIVEAYGNHPSFCMMAYGNEPGGKKQKEWLSAFVAYWKSQDNRRMYTSSAGWPNLPESDFLIHAQPRIQGWGAGLTSIINAEEPSTSYDWSGYTLNFNQPFISHEIGQWCAYPNYKEMQKYTGVYKARNFEIFQATLQENGLIHLADSFLLASGKLQNLCYKADIEAALRTPKLGGFQLLGLNDFPGQCTALVGALDVFWEEKGYATATDYSRFCNSLVPLARMKKLVYENNETFAADVEVANYRDELVHPEISWRVKDALGKVLRQGRLTADKLNIGNCQQVGSISFDLNDIQQAARLNLEVSVNGTMNDWNFWVYPSRKVEEVNKGILLTDRLNREALNQLKKGGKVLLSLRKGTLSKEFGGDIAIGFSSIFWNTAMTKGQAPHTLGILCNPSHPALSAFPTEYHSDYQWWDAMSHSGAISYAGLSENIHPIVHVIDDWFTNRPLALFFEVKVGKGKLLVSGIDFHQDMESRPAARQLLYSLKQYMKSDAFRPDTEISVEIINQLTTDQI